MNAKDLSLFYIITGVRGGCKTLAMTCFETEYLRDAWALRRLRKKLGDDTLHPRHKVNVWSSYPVETLWWTPFGKPVLLKAEELDIEKLIVWDPEFQDGVIFFDEIDQVADRQDWMSTVSKMLNAGVQVMRHRNLTFFTSIQSMEWLNSRLYWQADIVIRMRDLVFSSWGQDKKLKPGEVASATWIDKSGMLTGYSFEETKKVYPMTFVGKPFWHCYSTYHDFDVVKLKTKYLLKQPKVTIDMTGQEEEVNNDYEIMHETLRHLISQGKIRDVTAKELWGTAEDLGLKSSKQRMGKYLNEIGVGIKHIEGKGRYNLEQLVAMAK